MAGGMGELDAFPGDIAGVVNFQSVLFKPAWPGLGDLDQMGDNTPHAMVPVPVDVRIPE